MPFRLTIFSFSSFLEFSYEIPIADAAAQYGISEAKLNNRRSVLEIHPLDRAAGNAGIIAR